MREFFGIDSSSTGLYVIELEKIQYNLDHFARQILLKDFWSLRFVPQEV